MKLGAILGVLGTPDNPRAIAEQAQMLVGEGYESLWAAQSLGRGFIYPDPLMMLTVAATATEDVLLGTAIIQVPLYRPMDLAHRIFCLRQIAGDRLIIGVGVGSTKNDFDALGLNYENRFQDFKAGMRELRGILETGKLGSVRSHSLAAHAGHTEGVSRHLGKGRAHGSKGIRRLDRLGALPDGRGNRSRRREVSYYSTQAGGGTSVVSTTYVSAETDLGELKEKLQRFSEIGFDHAVAIVMPGGPSPAEVRKLVP